MGVYPAVTTKFTSNNSLDIEGFLANIQEQLTAGIAGVVLGGTLGEAASLSQQEKVLLLESALSVARGKVDVVVNIAEQTTEAAVALAKTLEAKGADGLMLLPPMRYAADANETLAYFKQVADATSLPIMIYNNPIDYKIPVTLEMFEEISHWPTIQAIKESSRDITYLTKLKIKFGNRFKILSGVDNLALESLLMGADGWVAGLVCAFPNETVAIYKLVQKKRYQEAIDIYHWFIPLLELDVHPKLVQYIKMAESLTGLGSEYVRPPRLPLAGEERSRIIRLINEGIRTRPTLPAFD